MTTEKGGQPAYNWTAELEDEICDTISKSHKGLSHHCKANSHWPNHDTIYQHIIRSAEFADKYAHAKERQQDCLVDYMMDICDDTSRDMYVDSLGNIKPNMTAVARDKLRADNIKWTAARLARKYRDKQVIEQHNVNHEASIKDLE